MTTTIILAACAAVVLWKLWAILGSHQDDGALPPVNPFNENKPYAQHAPGMVAMGSGTVAVNSVTPSTRWMPFAEPGSAAANGLDRILAADPTFDLSHFMQGAKVCYETLLNAFASGDRKSLRALANDEVYEGFNQVITAREARNEKMTLTFVSMDQAKVVDALQQGTTSEIVVVFHSKIINVSHDAKGQVTDGNGELVQDNEAIWTFARDVTSRDPNWKVISTHA